MITDTWILSLFLGECISVLLMLGVVVVGLRIAWTWDIGSTEREQLALERQSYLISTIIMYVFSFELLSLWLFVMIINDHLPPVIKGAMCGAGSLNTNEYGWPALDLKIAEFVMLSLWLVLHHLDRKLPEYPLTREKIVALLLLMPLIVSAFVVQILYFSAINPNIITTCCSITFDYMGGATKAGAIASILPETEIVRAFYVVVAIAMISDGLIFFSNRSARMVSYVFAPFNGIIQFVISSLALVYHYAKYIYGMPGHHCPFDMLWKEYFYIGYGIDILLFIALVSSLSVGMLGIVSRKASIQADALALARASARWNIISTTLLLAVLVGTELAWHSSFP